MVRRPRVVEEGVLRAADRRAGGAGGRGARTGRAEPRRRAPASCGSRSPKRPRYGTSIELRDVDRRKGLSPRSRAKHEAAVEVDRRRRAARRSTRRGSARTGRPCRSPRRRSVRRPRRRPPPSARARAAVADAARVVEAVEETARWPLAGSDSRGARRHGTDRGERENPACASRLQSARMLPFTPQISPSTMTWRRSLFRRAACGRRASKRRPRAGSSRSKCRGS